MSASRLVIKSRDYDLIRRVIISSLLNIIILVGSGTFGVPGVKEYCYFLKQLSDARAIRQRILECFEVRTRDWNFGWDGLLNILECR